MAFHCLHCNKIQIPSHGFYHFSTGISCVSHARLLFIFQRSFALCCALFHVVPSAWQRLLLPLPTGKILFLPPPFPEGINPACLCASYSTLFIPFLQYLSYCFILITLCICLPCEAMRFLKAKNMFYLSFLLDSSSAWYKIVLNKCLD